MKVIITKKIKNWKINEIIEVSDGYAKNFLIKLGYARPVNETNMKHLNSEIKKTENLKKAKEKSAFERKKQIEEVVLHFKLKTTNDVVHGSITNKQIIKSLANKGIQVIKYELPHNHIATIGKTFINANLYKGLVIAKIEIMVSKDE